MCMGVKDERNFGKVGVWWGKKWKVLKKKNLMKILEIESTIYKINSRLGTTEERIWKTIQTVQNLNYVTQRVT